MFLGHFGGAANFRVGFSNWLLIVVRVVRCLGVGLATVIWWGV